MHGRHFVFMVFRKSNINMDNSAWPWKDWTFQGALKDKDFEKTEVWTMKNEKEHLQSGKHRKETSGVLLRGLGDLCEKESG